MSTVDSKNPQESLRASDSALDRGAQECVKSKVRVGAGDQKNMFTQNLALQVTIRISCRSKRKPAALARLMREA